MRTTTPIEVPQNDAREYFHALGITAVFIAASPARSPCVIGHTRDLGQALESIRSRWHSSVGIAQAWWLANESKAQAILQAVEAAFPADGQGRIECDTDTIAARIERAAASAGAILTTHTKAIERVRAVIEYVDSMIASANATGELRWFNKRYKQWRMTAPADAAVGYTTMRSRLRAAVVRSVARGECRLGPELWGEVLRPGV